MRLMTLDVHKTAYGWASARLDDRYYMELALEQAKHAYSLGEVPIGAVVVYDPVDSATREYLLPAPKLLAAACNLRETTQDPAAHAEFLAMQAASHELGEWRLEGCTVYVTLEPCIMCAGLMHQARISRCVFGASDQKAGAVGTLYRIHDDARLNHAFPVEGGVMEEECQGLLKRFFKERREQRKAAKKERQVLGAAAAAGQAAAQADDHTVAQASAAGPAAIPVKKERQAAKVALMNKENQ
ncbi:MAG: nucleoside deaminase [Coriobacteriia bacterium]|nr:nucleoside deaminase [Coriobacteriia bacterium]